MTASLPDSWLIGADGVYRGVPMGAWQRLGDFNFKTNTLRAEERRIVVGVHCGVYELSPVGGQWRQLHDETVTEVLTFAACEGDPGVLIGSPYGVASARIDERGAARWTFYAEGLRVNERFTNVIARTGTPGRYLLGTEAGVLVFDMSTGTFDRTSLTGFPVRTIIYAFGRYYAGTDGHGVWVSDDCEVWHPAGTGIDHETVISLSCDGESLIAGTDHGVMARTGLGHWRRLGPSVLVSAVAADPVGAGRWLVGTMPAGLWWTEDAGRTWRQTGAFGNVGAIVPPETPGFETRSDR